MERLIARFEAGAKLGIASEATPPRNDKISVLDVGSRDFNGSYRATIEDRGWWYTGLDLARGENVDIVSADPYRYPIEDGAFDLVISGSTMEHVAELGRWVAELVRVLRPGGMLAIVTHWSFVEHRYPELGFLDYWRIMPDGMRWLFDRAGELERYEIGIVSEYDVAASAWKRAGDLASV